MNKAVLLSVKPKWCELIAIQRKTLEIRKSRPSIETPFKVYIYQTKGKWLFSVLGDAGMTSIAEILESGLGLAVGEFICDYIVDISVPYPAYFREMNSDILKQSCLTYADIHRYSGTRNVYGWHISDLRIYAEPKPLSEFYAYCPKEYCSDGCPKFKYNFCDLLHNGRHPISRAPQSYCFVEELP